MYPLFFSNIGVFYLFRPLALKNSQSVAWRAVESRLHKSSAAPGGSPPTAHPVAHH